MDRRQALAVLEAAKERKEIEERFAAVFETIDYSQVRGSQRKGLAHSWQLKKARVYGAFGIREGSAARAAIVRDVLFAAGAVSMRRNNGLDYFGGVRFKSSEPGEPVPFEG